MRTGGPNTATYSSDASATAGRQVITATNGGHAIVLEINGVGYIKANATALVGFLGLPAAIASGWPTSGSHSMHQTSDTSGLSRASRLAPSPMSWRSRAASGRWGCARSAASPVVALRGGVPPAWGLAPGVNATLYVAAAGQPLPVTFDGGISGGQGEFLTFSKWGEPLHLAAPATSISSSSVMTS